MAAFLLPSLATILPPTHRHPSRVWRLANISVALLLWIVVVNISLLSFSSRHSTSASTTATTSVKDKRQSLITLAIPAKANDVVRRQKCRLFAGGRLHLRQKANEWGSKEQQQQQQQQHANDIGRILIHFPNSDDADNIIQNIHFASQQNDNTNALFYSVRLQELLNYTNNSTHQISNATHNNNSNNNNETQSTTSTKNEQNSDDTIFDDLTRGFTFAALSCLSLYCLHKCCCYACIRCGCCPDDERVLQARLRKLRLMKKRAYNPDNIGGAVPPLDTRKWAQWMMAHRGTVDTAEDSSYYYSAVVPAGGSRDNGDGGVWDASSDDGSTAWDDETGFVDFEDTATTSLDDGREVGERIELTSRSNAKNAIPELEYGEGEELEDESHDSRLFDAEDGGKGVIREADKFFMGGRRGRENGDNGIICQTRKTKDRAFVVDRNRNNRDREQDTNPTNFDLQQNIMPDQSFIGALEQPRLCGRNDAASILTSIPRTNDAETSSAMQMFATVPHDTIPTADELAGNENEDMEIVEMDTDIIDAGDRGYDEETDLLGLRSDSPPPMDLEEMSRIEKKMMEDMENAKPY